MMHEREKSDPAIGAGKPTNKAEASAHAEHGVSDAAEPAEQRAGAKGNADEQSTHRTQGRERVSQALDRVRKAARLKKDEKFTALLHHINLDLLREAFFALKRDAAPGVDGVTWRAYEADLDLKLTDLASRVHRGAYRALPSRRTYIPKADGSQRPLAVTALEDKIVQRATADVLNCIFEEDFLGFSYGFRSGRGQHNALDALCVGIDRKKVNFILDADIRSFFNSIPHEALMARIEARISDGRVLDLIRGWLTADILSGLERWTPMQGSPQGAVISPLLANIYLDPLDRLMADHGYRMVRYADDFVILCRTREEALTALGVVRAWTDAAGVKLHPTKTHVGDCRLPGQGFEFLG